MEPSDALVLTRALARRTDDDTAARWLRDKRETLVLLFDLAMDAPHIDGGESRLNAFLNQVGDEDGPVSDQIVPLLPHAGPTGDRVAVMRIATRGRVAIVAVQSVGVLATPWPPSVAQATTDTIRSVITRHARELVPSTGWGAFVGAVSEEVGSLNALLISRVIEDVTRTARGAFAERTDPKQFRRRAFEQILDTRSRLAEVIAHFQAHGHGSASVVSELQNATAACDALTASLAGMAAVVMQEQSSLRAAEQERRDRIALQRDRDIARLAAALILPGLWIGFLGANVLPTVVFGLDLQSDTVALVSLCIALALAVVGWFLIPKAFTWYRSDKKT
ncbi:hypothetical protein [Microbacterium sp.]|uniref:hypothetical protein n=1 Tax=Microbacterium sp. TaxID=51671 RepID=UPI002D765176|nr:hypothetical protein [Microbacterium sp.]HET6302085.1 hypothetical protein [Microbacterium sp.]